jgi:predicted PurR-regulated permease PerM
MNNNKKNILFFNIDNIIFLILFFIFFVVIFYLLKPFFFIILWAATLTILISPIYNFLVSIIINNIEKISLKFKLIYKFKDKIISIIKSIFAFLFSIILFLIIIFLTSYLFTILSKQIFNFAKELIDFFSKNNNFLIYKNFNNIIDYIYNLSGGLIDLYKIDLKYEIIQLAQNISTKIFSNTTKILNLFIRNITNIFMIIFTIYFFLIDGHNLKEILINSLPIERKYLNIFEKKFKEVSLAITNGYIFVSIIQATIASIIFFLFNIENYFLLGLFVFISSFIPIIGNAGIWLPVSIFKFFLNNRINEGIFFIIICLIFITLLDYFLRPYILKDSLKLHPFLIFLSMLGGIYKFSLSGIILGPLFYILFFTILDIYKELKNSNFELN